MHKQQPELEALHKKWITIEFFGMIFSISGLILAILEYEWDLDNGGYKGLGLIPDTGDDTSMEIEKAIHDRLDDKWTFVLRSINCVTCVLTIAMLILRRYHHIIWVNKYFHEELKREKMNIPHVEFINLDVF